MSDKLDSITERLDWIEISLSRIAIRQIKTHTRLKEIQTTMATQADVDAVTAQLEGLKTEIVKIGADFTAFANRPGITLEALQAKSTEVGTSLQAVDDLIPEQDAPANA